MKAPRKVYVAALMLVFGAISAKADLNSKNRVRSFAALPDWTGYWEQDSINLGLGGEPTQGDVGFLATKLWLAHPPYNADWEAQYQARPQPPEHTYCEWGFPAIMDSPYTQFEMVVTPEQTLFIPVMLHATRQIFTDGRAHPPKDESWTTALGDSIGRWEGQTLIVDTISRKAGPIADRNDLSDQAHFVERIRLLGKDRMEDQITIEDPIALARPWYVTLTFRRMKGVDRLIPADCLENDRNPLVNGEFKIAPRKP